MKVNDMRHPQTVCWLFCAVIDNFGDMGVCLRLAQMLHRELGWQVVLWTNDAEALRRLSPEIPTLPAHSGGITFRQWRAGISADGWETLAQPEVVIEAFACDLPPDVREMVRMCRPLWLNWEYLSAEDWAEAMHLKPSTQGDGTQKFFWLMGFGEHGGGLLRERDYEQRRQGAAALRQTLGLPEKQGREWLVFGYENGPWCAWLAMWRQAGTPMTLFLAGGQVLSVLKRGGAIPRDVLCNDGDSFQAANVRLVRLPFVPQSQFDRLLANFDGAIVRGEDSFVRAQLGGQPFLWHIYPQDEQAHIEKLHAFWQRCRMHYPETVFTALQQLSDDLNSAAVLSAEARAAAWRRLESAWTPWQQASAAWSQYLAAQSSSVERLRTWLASTKY